MGSSGLNASLIIGTGCRVQVFSLILDSSVGLSASIQSAGDLVSGTPGSNPAFWEEHNLSPFDLNIACLCQSIEINNNKYVYRQTQVESPDSVVKWAECSLIIGKFKFLAWQLSRFVSEHSVCWRFGVWDPGFKSCILQRNTTCLLSIWISLACARASKLTTTNMYITRARCESQLTVGSSECSLIIGTGCRVQVFSLILDSSVGLSASIQSAGDLVSGTPGSNPAFGFKSCLVSFRFEYRLPVPEHRGKFLAWTTNMYIARSRFFSESQLHSGVLSIWISLACARASKLTTTNMYIARASKSAKVNWQWGQVGWMLADHRDGL